MNLSNYNNENYVAHYTKLHTLIRLILPNNNLRLSPIKTLNDPYENTLDWLDIENIGDVTINQRFMNGLNLGINKSKLSNFIKVFSTTNYDEEGKNNIGISSHIYCRPRMWAQYGDNHKGVCLIFDKKELQREFESLEYLKLYADKVEYLEHLEMINNDISIEASLLPEVFENPDKVCTLVDKNNMLKHRFFRKHIDWKSEAEYRWLIFSNKEDDIYLDFGKSLKAIVLGCDVQTNDFKCLQHYDIQLYTLSFINGKYETNKILNIPPPRHTSP